MIQPSKLHGMPNADTTLAGRLDMEVFKMENCFSRFLGQIPMDFSFGKLFLSPFK